MRQQHLPAAVLHAPDMHWAELHQRMQPAQLLLAPLRPCCRASCASRRTCLLHLQMSATTRLCNVNSCSECCRSLPSLSCPAAWPPCRKASAALVPPSWRTLAGLRRCPVAWQPAEQPPTPSTVPASAQCTALGSCLPFALLSFQAGSSPQTALDPPCHPCQHTLAAAAACCSAEEGAPGALQSTSPAAADLPTLTAAPSLYSLVPHHWSESGTPCTNPV